MRPDIVLGWAFVPVAAAVLISLWFIGIDLIREAKKTYDVLPAYLFAALMLCGAWFLTVAGVLAFIELWKTTGF